MAKRKRKRARKRKHSRTAERQPTAQAAAETLQVDWRKRLVSLFIVANLITIGWMNIPPEWRTEAKRPFAAVALTERATAYTDWAVQIYAHFVGLDNCWQMFGRQSRFNWAYVIKADYGDGEQRQSVILPLPRQSQRTVAQRALIDFKEAKFHLNIYNNRLARESYARYLARQYPEHNGLPIREITYDLGFQYILPPEEAMRQQKLIDPRRYCQTLDVFTIPPQTGELP